MKKTLCFGGWELKHRAGKLVTIAALGLDCQMASLYLMLDFDTNSVCSTAAYTAQPFVTCYDIYNMCAGSSVCMNAAAPAAARTTASSHSYTSLSAPQHESTHYTILLCSTIKNRA